ncbi:uncharacterized protein [Apostichopus japonicus]|uniref:uncharacterized protein isoform X3 n=1 Tax=Stichopus japonicus TaxID=307972 RepID=UPI003AB5320F
MNNQMYSQCIFIKGSPYTRTASIMHNQSVISKDFEVRFINDTIGFTLQSGVPYTKTVESGVHLTMAALDENCNNGNELKIKDVAGKTRCQVLVRVHSTDDILLCTLVDGLIFQQNLNLTLMPGEKATFHAKGGKVHLTGYSKSHLEDNSQLFRDEEWEDKISQRDSENQNRIGVPEEDCIDEILEEVQTVTSQELEFSPVQVKQEILDNHSLDSLDFCAPSDKKTSLVSVKTEEPDEGSCSSQQEQPESSSADAHDESVPFTCDIQTTTDTSTQHPDVECIQEAIALSRSPSPVPEHHNIMKPLTTSMQTNRVGYKVPRPVVQVILLLHL